MDLDNWKEEYLVGIKSIDEQHRRLFAQMDALTLALYKGQAASAIEEMIDFLDEYTEEHFNHEEELMMKYRYPEMQKHKELHDKFRSILFSFKSEMSQSGPSHNLALRLEQEIIGWYKNHILGIDKKMSLHLKNKLS